MLPKRVMEEFLSCPMPQPVAGVDEAGCGPWAGPVVAGAVIIDSRTFPNEILDLLGDSKKLTRSQRQKAYEGLCHERGRSCWIGQGMASAQEVDRLNVRRASHVAMIRAVMALPVPPGFLLVDGTHVPPQAPWPGKAVIGGDGKHHAIAAASIVAKVLRDGLMASLAKIYQGYSWEKNAGYGTKAHREAMEKHGLSPYHRHSFQPVQKFLSPLAA